jgi:glycosyltransferase involved in cell wall biosynthesis
MPTVSVFIPVYNAAAFVKRAIDSIRQQTFSDWELVIVDDKSTDSSYMICQAVANTDSKIKLYQNDRNLGMRENWNRGIELCRSEFFVKLDADDFFHPMMLEKCLSIIRERPEVGMVFAKYVNVDEVGKVLDPSEIQLPAFARNTAFSCIPLVRLGVSKMLQYPVLRQGMGLMRRKIFEELGNYRILLSKETEASTDTEFYFRVGCHYLIHCIDETLYFYRVHGASISRVDFVNGLQELKMFEIKMCINDYYFKMGHIGRSAWRTNRDEALFYYHRFLLYKFRKQKQYIKFFSLFMNNLMVRPTKILRFYLNRLIKSK